jgi:hypothetical protein
MSLLSRKPSPRPAVDEPTVDLSPDQCAACLRTGVPLVDEVHYGVRMKLCPDPAGCRRNWPREAA